MNDRKAYLGWKRLFFWGVWLLLLAPAYCAAFGAWLIGSMLPDYHDPIDIILTIIMVATLCLLMIVAAYTSWHFIKATRGYAHLMFSVIFGLLFIPMVSALGAIFSYVQWA